MTNLAIQQKTQLSVDAAVAKVSEAIKEAGFGILTRIDFDQKIKEKLDKNLPKTVILGACNPKLAYEAYLQTTDVALLIPCNIVVRENPDGTSTIEAMRPSQMLNFLPSLSQFDQVHKAEAALEKAVLGIR